MLARSNNTNKLSPQELIVDNHIVIGGSNNTNKLSPQEHSISVIGTFHRSNNTNKLSPQEPVKPLANVVGGSNNTNKLSPQEQCIVQLHRTQVQIIQINLVLKNITTHS